VARRQAHGSRRLERQVAALLTPTDHLDIFLIEPGVRESGEHAVFRRLPDGRVESLYLSAGTYKRLDPVE
jgi:hypothetical protein